MSFVDNLEEGDRYFVSVEDCREANIDVDSLFEEIPDFVEFSFVAHEGDHVFGDVIESSKKSRFWVAKNMISHFLKKKAEPESEAVNHPSHYNMGKIEVIDAIEDWQLNFNRGSMIKYIARAGRKNPAKEKEDLEKARFYLNREIAALGEK